ncbi:hypothetical protein U0355_02860 [Salimicrobium sp. PL1-032A]|uniref:hypothetical protein n=1 Tax=Salimicrobium sp. PL1-032A TaxID=3095364 RepID=UPI003260C019
MKLWMRKLFVTLVAIMTLGLYVPPAQINPEASDKGQITGAVERETEETEDFFAPMTVDDLTERAKEQTIAKLGHVSEPGWRMRSSRRSFRRSKRSSSPSWMTEMFRCTR